MYAYLGEMATLRKENLQLLQDLSEERLADNKVIMSSRSNMGRIYEHRIRET
jgi:hypothetical protein